jgi:hypothetical protein
MLPILDKLLSASLVLVSFKNDTYLEVRQCYVKMSIEEKPCGAFVFLGHHVCLTNQK